MERPVKVPDMERPVKVPLRPSCIFLGSLSFLAASGQAQKGETWQFVDGRSV